MSKAPPLPSFPVTPSEGPVGGRLHLFWQNWQVIEAEDWVVLVLRKGYYLPLTDHVPLTLSPPNMGYSSSHPLFQELRHQLDILQVEIYAGGYIYRNNMSNNI